MRPARTHGRVPPPGGGQRTYNGGYYFDCSDEFGKWAATKSHAVHKIRTDTLTNYSVRWLGSRVVSVLDSGAEGPGFKSQPRHCRVTVLGKLFTLVVPLFTKQQNW